MAPPSGKGSEVSAALALHGFFDSTQVVFRQKAAVGAGVGQELVAFVEALGKGQRILGGKAEAVVGLALQRSQIVERGCTLAALLAALRDRRRLPAAPPDNGQGPVLLPDAALAGLRILLILLESRVDLEPLIAHRATEKMAILYIIKTSSL